MTQRFHMSRRNFIGLTTMSGGLFLASQFIPARWHSPALAVACPQLLYGIQSGDVTNDSAVIWSRSDRPARMIVEYAEDENFSDTKKVIGEAALIDSDYTAKLNLQDLPPGTKIFYRVIFQDLENISLYSKSLVGSFFTAPVNNQDIRFLWSGDMAGQGWGINLEWGGMKIFETMRNMQPHFFIHCGDRIYADSPIPPVKKLADGTVWKNVTTEAKSKVAETLDEFRGNYAYNLMDVNVRRFNAEVAQYVLWDDHETTNNWYPQERLTDDERYQMKSAALLSARAKQAFVEYTPIRATSDIGHINRMFSHGPLMDLFLLDMRSYRGPNTSNRQQQRGPETEFLGRNQLQWLKRKLMESSATWKIIAADMPIGLIVRDGKSNFDNMANGDGPPLGRELEMADLLRFIKKQEIKNVVWFTADVHYTAAHYYDPKKARFMDFIPFWEFVSGPLHAGSFGPNRLDNTFGPQLKFQKTREDRRARLSPVDGLQFFGQVDINGNNRELTVSLKDLTGATLYHVDLHPN